MEEYDREPTLWQTNNNGRPWRLTGVGRVRAALRSGQAVPGRRRVLSHIARGWSVSGTYEYQPGALLNWGNIFFNGDLADIKKDKPEIALQARRHVRPDEDVVQHRRRVRARHGRSAGRLPEAGVPVPGRRGSRAKPVDDQYEHRAHVQSGRPRTFQFRADIQNLLNRQHYQNPNLDPTSTNFGQVRA